MKRERRQPTPREWERITSSVRWYAGFSSEDLIPKGAA
jgi:hypothetical protein